VPIVRRVEAQWGTMITVEVRDAQPPAELPRAFDRLFDWFRRVDDLFSTWRADTEVSRLGRGALALADASPEVREVLALCESVRATSGGAFDVTVAQRALEARPGAGPVDPSGLVKGWAVDRGADLLAAAGARRVCINAGGDVAVRGGRPEPWRVGIQHPTERDRVAAVVAVAAGGIATSGRAERGDHVLDPRTGRPARGLASVTVVGPDLALADGYATAALAMGDDGMAWLAERPDVDGLGITDDGRVLWTVGFDRWRVE
jgi:thiamine biosynthesis lipoprotein